MQLTDNREPRDRLERDHEYLAAEPSDLLVPPLHLDQVRLARESGEMPQKDQNERTRAPVGELDPLPGPDQSVRSGASAPIFMLLSRRGRRSLT